MGDYRQLAGFLYCWRMNKTLLISPVCGGLLQRSIHHVTVSIPSSAQGIASFSSAHRFFLRVSFQLPILVLLL
jgi:hypothetical protein